MQRNNTRCCCSLPARTLQVEGGADGVEVALQGVARLVQLGGHGLAKRPARQQLPEGVLLCSDKKTCEMSQIVHRHDWHCVCKMTTKDSGVTWLTHQIARLGMHKCGARERQLQAQRRRCVLVNLHRQKKKRKRKNVLVRCEQLGKKKKASKLNQNSTSPMCA